MVVTIFLTFIFSINHSQLCVQEQTEVKHAFLEEALVNLDLSNSVTKVAQQFTSQLCPH